MSGPPPVAPIAVIGMSARFPGADGLDAFWDLLAKGRDAIREVPPERWDLSRLYDPEVGAPGKIATRHAGLIDGVDLFDATLFGLTAREAATMDPQQRLVLELAWHALEDAGLAPDRLRGSATGVFVGICNWDYNRLLLRDPSALDGHAVTGSALSIAANRLSYVLGLEGPSLAVDTACSSSLTALHLACQSLRLGECGLALCGGVNLLLTPEASISLSRAGMLAPDGRCKVFSAAADGYVRGEGGGILVLRRLEDALAAGEPVRAVLLGSAVNQDGASNGLTAPNPRAQVALLRAACAAAGVDPARVDYVEAHGTGTRLGDPIEVKALAEVLGEGRPAGHPLAMGSVKSNIGHLEAAAGVAGVIKTVLALERGTLPPSLHCEELNPLIPWGELPVRVQTEPGLWPQSQETPVAGVSSFSFGGTNVHVLLQAAPPRLRAPAEPENPCRVLVLSAATEEALRAQAGLLAGRLAVDPDLDLDDTAHTLAACRARLRHRLAVPAPGRDAAVRELDVFARGGQTQTGLVGRSLRRTRPALLFTGQGSQWPGMARDLWGLSPVFRETLETCAALAEGKLERPLLPLLIEAGEEDEGIHRTALSQPALFAFEVALAAHWRSWGFEPEAVIGHSVGEYAAACVAGGVSLAGALDLVILRGRLMQALPAGGGMIAVGASEERLRELLAGRALEDRVDLAAVNGASACTLSGDLAALADLALELAAAEITTRPLTVSHAFHSPLVEPMLDELERAAGEVEWRPLELPLASNLTGALVPAGERLDAAYWRRHTRETVRFAGGLAALLAEGHRLFLEVGPRPVLTAFGRRLPAPEPVAWVASLRGREDGAGDLARALGELWVNGLEPGWRAVDGGRRRAFVRLPGYAFDRRRHWVSEPAAQAPPLAPAPSPAPVVSPAPAGGRQAILDALVGDLAALLQCAPEEVDPHMPFLEMGADSIVMIDAVRRIERRFGVAVKISRLFEELSTLSALAGFLEEALPAAPAAAHAPSPAPAASPSSVSAAQKVLPAFRRAETSRGHLSEAQRRHLEDLARRYNARTPGSKQLAERYRPVLADSRASAGFRLSTKEMLYPIVGSGGSGSRLRDVDGNEYLDITMGFGVHLFGHRPPFVEEAVARQLAEGWELGPRAALAGRVAERLVALTGMERVAFCNSGTEAVMTALRIARTVAGRHKVALFSGSYHGHSDGTLGMAEDTEDGPGGVPSPAVPGVPPGAVEALLVLDYGAEESLRLLRARAGELAAVLVEPVQSRHPEIQPAEFLAELRRITAEAGVALIFDEMITGFRIGAGGAQDWFGVRADLATYGKIVGGGLPIGVIAGRAAWMDAIDGGAWRYGDASYPGADTTFLAGTFCQHPLAMAAADAVLAEIERRGPALYADLNARSARLVDGLNACLEELEAPIRTARFGSLFRFLFRENLDLLFFHLLDRGVYVWEGRNCFLSTAHGDGDAERVIEAVRGSLLEMRAGGFLPAKKPREMEERKEEEFELSESQRQLWALAAVSPEGKRAYNLSIALELEGDLDAAALEAALAGLVRRHGALRTVFAPDGSGQRVLNEVPVRLEAVDLRGASWETVEERLAEGAGRDLDLAAGPLFAVDLLRLEADRHLLQLTVHHLVADGLSLGLLVDELGRFYSGETRLDPPRSYRDFVRWHREHRDDPAQHAAEAHWASLFQDGIPVLDLPGDRPRPPIRTFHGGRRTRELPPEVTREVARLAAEVRCTPLMVLLGIFAVLLHRLTGQEDLVIGLPTAGRPFEGPLVGYCTHLLPVRSRLLPGEAAGAWLRGIRGTVLEALEHGDYPFARMVERLLPRRDPSRPALVSVTFNLDRPPAAPGFAGLAVRLVPVPLHHARFDLTLNVTDVGDRLLLEADYDAEIFDAATVDSLLAAYEGLLGGLAARPEAPVEAVPLPLPPEDEGEILAPDEVLTPRLAPWVAADPHRVVMTGSDGAITFGALDAETNRLARVLERRGVGPEVPVTLVAGRSVDAILALVAVLKAGGAYVPIEVGTPAARIARIVAGSGSRLVLWDGEPPEVVSAGAGEGPPVVAVRALRAEAAGESAGPLAVQVYPENLVYILYTSGSTGEPKGVGIEHRQLCSYMDAFVARTGLEPGCRYAALSSLQMDAILSSLLPALFLGGSLAMVAASRVLDPLAVVADLAGPPVDLLKITPSHLGALLDGPDPAALLPRRWLVVGGEAMPPGLVEKVRAIAPDLTFFNHYGPTEVTVGVTMYELPAAPGARIPLGKALPNSRVHVVDRHGRRLPAGFPGEIVLGGAGVARGYVGRGELTAQAFRPDPESPVPGARRYHTGDVGRLRPDGNIEYLGRRDDQVKIRGHRIEPGEVASALQGVAGIVQSAVVVDRGPSGDVRLVGYASRAPGRQEPSEAEVLRELRTRLPEAMVPAMILFLDTLPLTPSGKVNRKALPPVPREREKEKASAVAARTPAEARLLEIWRALLPGAEPGVTDDFFALGGDSIVAIQVAGRAASAGLRITPAQVFSLRTVEALAAVAAVIVVAGEAPDAREQALPAVGPLALTPLQLQFLAAGPARPDHWNLSLLLDGPPAPDTGALARAAAGLARHHDALRARFAPGPDGIWTGWIAEREEAPLLTVADLSGIDADAEDALLDRAADAAQASLDLTAGPLARFVLFQRGPSRPSRLLVVAHHLVMDGVSWPILLEDLEEAWRQETAGGPWRPRPKTVPFRAWTERLESHAGLLAAAGEAERWREALAGAGASLPLDHPGEADLEGEARVLSLELGPERTAVLLRRAREAYGAGPTEVLLAALVEAAAPRTGRHRLLVELEGHGRDALDALGDGLDLSRTVGFFTARFPLWLDLEAADGPGAALLAVREHLRRLPGTAGFGLLRFKAPDAAVREALAALPEPAISVNYLGSYDGLLAAGAAFRPAVAGGVVGRGRGRESHPDHRRRHALALDALVWGGRLRIDLTYGRRLAETTVAALGGRLLAALEALADHCLDPGAGALAPSDFPLAGLTVEKLERLLGRLGLSGPARPAVSRETVSDVYPLSPIQQGMLFHTLAEPGLGMYVDQQLCLLEGELDRAAFVRAWEGTLAAHPSLRAAFVSLDADAPLQVIREGVSLPVEELDWSGLSPSGQERRLADLLAADASAGFDLERPPLARLRLIRLGPAVVQMLWTHHHLIVDGWSSGLLFQEVLERYRAAVRGEEAERPAPPPFRSYIEWLARRDEGEAERFWRETLSGMAPPAALDGGMVEEASPGFEQTGRSLPGDAAARLADLARRTGVTLNNAVQAAWAVLLARYGGEPDVVMGVTVAGRPPELPGVEAMVGNFINVLPLRLRYSRGETVAGWLAAVQAASSGVLAYSHSSLVDVRRWAGLPPEHPLFHSALVFENYPTAALEGPVADGLRVTELRSVERSNLPLTLTVETSGGGLSFVLAYDQTLFDRATCDRILGHLEALLLGMARHPEARLGELNMGIDEDLRTPAPAPEPAPLLPAVFARRVAEAPDAVALRGPGWSWSYAELDRRSNRVAHGLLDLSTDSPFVALLLDSGPETVAAMFGALKAGRAFACLDPGIPGERLRWILEEIRPGALLAAPAARACHGGLLQELERAGCRVLDPAAAGQEAPETLPPVELTGREPAYAVYTSGSTGRPKGIVQTQAALAQIIDWHVKEFRVSAASRVAQWAIPSYDASYGEIFTALAAGATLCPVDPEVRMDPASTARWLAAEKVTLFQTVPSYLLRLLAEEAGEAALAGLDTLLLAGEALDGELARRARALLPSGARLYNLYGPTECFLATFQEIRQEVRAVGRSRRPVPIGREIPGREVLLLDEEGRPCPAGVPGEVFLRSPFLCEGYLDRPEETAARFAADPLGRVFRTGDFARRRVDGTLEFLGRRDDQVKLRGMRVELGEIAAALARHPGVREAAAAIQTDEDGDRSWLVAYVAAREDSAPPEPVELLRHARQSLPPHMVPVAVVFLPALPRLANGKIDRTSLPPYRPGDAEGESGQPPATPLEQRIAEVWAGVLGHRPIHREDGFFALGGHSLLAGRMVNALRAQGLPDLPVRLVFDAPTLEEFAAAVARRGEDRAGLVAEVIGLVESLSEEEVRSRLAGDVPVIPKR